jgi:hypothetical protein
MGKTSCESVGASASQWTDRGHPHCCAGLVQHTEERESLSLSLSLSASLCLFQGNPCIRRLKDIPAIPKRWSGGGFLFPVAQSPAWGTSYY